MIYDIAYSKSVYIDTFVGYNPIVIQQSSKKTSGQIKTACGDIEGESSIRMSDTGKRSNTNCN